MKTQKIIKKEKIEENKIKVQEITKKIKKKKN